MKTVLVNDNNITPLVIGHMGEKNILQVAFDYTEWEESYGDGTLSLVFQRPGDSVPYPVILENDGTTAVWNVTDTDTALQGEGKGQLVYVVDEKIKKNAIFRAVVYNSLEGGADPPTPYERWIDEATVLATETIQARDEALAILEQVRNIADSIQLTAIYDDGRLTLGITHSESEEK